MNKSINWLWKHWANWNWCRWMSTNWKFVLTTSNGELFIIFFMKCMWIDRFIFGHLQTWWWSEQSIPRLIVGYDGHHSHPVQKLERSRWLYFQYWWGQRTGMSCCSLIRITIFINLVSIFFTLISNSQRYVTKRRQLQIWPQLFHIACPETLAHAWFRLKFWCIKKCQRQFPQ